MIDVKTIPQMVAAYLESAMEWSYNGLPRGNIPVVMVYMHAAQTIYSGEVDFSVVERYSKDHARLKSGLDWLVEITDNNLPRFMQPSVILNQSKCLDALQSESQNNFVSEFMAGNGPPEERCNNGSKFQCNTWCNSNCKDFWNMIIQARSFSYDTAVSEVPRCSRCPGLTGIVRESFPQTNKNYERFKWFPQCLPFQFPNGDVVTSPEALVEPKGEQFC